jgi:hypothetical protein
VTPQKHVRLFSDFSWWFKIMPLLLELKNHLYKRPFQLGKGINKAIRTHRPLSKDLNLSKKSFFFWGGIAYKNHRKGVKKVSFKKKHGLMLLVKKNHQKTARDLN